MYSPIHEHTPARDKPGGSIALSGQLVIEQALIAVDLVASLSVTPFLSAPLRPGCAPTFEVRPTSTLDLIESPTLDSQTLDFVYRPTLH